MLNSQPRFRSFRLRRSVLTTAKSARPRAAWRRASARTCCRKSLNAKTWKRTDFGTSRRGVFARTSGDHALDQARSYTPPFDVYDVLFDVFLTSEVWGSVDC